MSEILHQRALSHKLTILTDGYGSQFEYKLDEERYAFLTITCHISPINSMVNVGFYIFNSVS